MTALPRIRAPAREAPNPERALGSNIAGAVAGGLAESCSAVLGFQYLLFVAIGSYLFSTWLPRLQRDLPDPVDDACRCPDPVAK
jgi:hypothetical protein